MRFKGLVTTATVLLVVAAFSTGCSPMKSLGYARIKTDVAPLQDRLSDLQAEKSRLMVTNQALGDESEALRLKNANLANEVSTLSQQIEDAETPADTTNEELAALRKDIQEWAKSQGIERNPRTGALVIRVQFAFGSAKIDAGSKKALNRIAGKLKTIPPGYVIYVDGHTDDVRIAKPKTKKAHVDLDGLSAHRALAVFRALKDFGVNPSRMRYRGFADRVPMVPGTTAAARRKNRRVEISILPERKTVAVK